MADNITDKATNILLGLEGMFRTAVVVENDTKSDLALAGHFCPCGSNCGGHYQFGQGGTNALASNIIKLPPHNIAPGEIGGLGASAPGLEGISGHVSYQIVGTNMQFHLAWFAGGGISPKAAATMSNGPVGPSSLWVPNLLFPGDPTLVGVFNTNLLVSGGILPSAWSNNPNWKDNDFHLSWPKLSFQNKVLNARITTTSPRVQDNIEIMCSLTTSPAG